jgi:hypothetical protein
MLIAPPRITIFEKNLVPWLLFGYKLEISISLLSQIKLNLSKEKCSKPKPHLHMTNSIFGAKDNMVKNVTWN